MKGYTNARPCITLIATSALAFVSLACGSKSSGGSSSPAPAPAPQASAPVSSPTQGAPVAQQNNNQPPATPPVAPGTPPAQPTQPSQPVQPTQLTVVNGSQLQTTFDGTVNLSWDPNQIQGGTVSCSIDQQPAQNCTAGLPLNLDVMEPGQHTLNVTATSTAGTQIGVAQLVFCSGSGCAPASPAAATPFAFQIGSFYSFAVPPQMHVTEYATNKTQSGNLSFYRIMPSSDPYYLGNYACNGQFDQQINVAGNAAGSTMDYCWTTPPTDQLFKVLTGARIADNHLEVATDVNEVTPENHVYIDINVFDSNYEYMYGRSRFEQLCANQVGNLQVTPPMAVMANDFWGVGSVNANFFMCTTQLVMPTGPGLPTMDPNLMGDTWWVGTFFIAASSTSLPQFQCFNSMSPPSYCGTFSNPSLLEVTFVTKTTYPNAAEFARAAQATFVAGLNEIQPTGQGIAPLPIGPNTAPVPNP